MSEAAFELMRQADCARRENRLDDARRNLVEAIAICRRAGVVRELVRALKRLGHVEQDLGHSDAVRTLYEEAVRICREVGDPLLLAHTIRHLGDTHLGEGRLASAEPCYCEALTLYRSRERTPPVELANALRPMAMLKDKAGEHEEARRLWEEARDLYLAANVPEGVAECSARLAQTLQ